MDKKEAAIIKVLNDVGQVEEPVLSPEQEQMLTRALDPEAEFLHCIKKLFKSEDK